jgi:hypothetical protein
MPPLPLTVRWGAPQRGRVLLVAFAYHGRDRDGAVASFLERRESAAARGHRIVHRDHYANPRPWPYVAALLAAATDLLCDQPPDVVIDESWDGDPARDLGWCRSVTRAAIATAEAWQTQTLKQLAAFDHVVLIYPDALGLGCAAAERTALRHHRSVLVINGRRRAFRLDGSLHRRLQRHRWLAQTRIVERLLARVMVPVGALLARRDRAATDD